MVNKVAGHKKLERELKKVARRAPWALAGALFEEASLIFVESQEEVPVDSGRLRGSGLVMLHGWGDRFDVWISYGTDYAVEIHERTELDAKRKLRRRLSAMPGYTPRGATSGKSKYLQDPFERAEPGLIGRVVKHTRKRMKFNAKRPRTIKGKKKGR